MNTSAPGTEERLEENSEAGETRVLIADDHPLCRAGLRSLFQNQQDLVVCGEAHDHRETLRELMAGAPDLLILDLNIEGGLGLLKSIRSRFPGTAVLILSTLDESIYAVRAIRAGARGYVSKSESGVVLLKAIRHVLSGEIHLSRTVSAGIVNRYVRGEDENLLDILTDRELEVFCLVGEGLASREIGNRMGISIGTVGAYKARIKEKLNITTSAQLTKAATEWLLGNDSKPDT